MHESSENVFSFHKIMPDLSRSQAKVSSHEHESQSPHTLHNPEAFPHGNRQVGYIIRMHAKIVLVATCKSIADVLKA